MPSSKPFRQKSGCILVRGARTHNLKSIDLEIPYYRLTSFCGLSGSGKSSLALDVLYAEGRRRYVECFSTRARQFLEKMERADVDLIEGLPPSVAVTAQPFEPTSLATVGVATETSDYLRLLFSKIGVPYCLNCGREVRRDSAETIAKTATSLPQGVRVMVAFAPSTVSMRRPKEEFEAYWLKTGFRRGIVLDESFDLGDGGMPSASYMTARLLQMASENGSDEDAFYDAGVRFSESDAEHGGVEAKENASGKESGRSSRASDPESLNAETWSSKRVLTLDANPDDSRFMRLLKAYDVSRQTSEAPSVFLIVDRLTVGKATEKRWIEAIEQALENGEGRCWLFAEGDCSFQAFSEGSDDAESSKRVGCKKTVDGVEWTLVGFSRNMRCEDCGLDFPKVEPNLFNYNSPHGECPVCGGTGFLMEFAPDLVCPNKTRSIYDGAVAPWNVPAYKSELPKFLALAPQLGVRADVPVQELTTKELNALYNGSSALNYGGLNGFFTKLLAEKHKMNIRVFLSRWQRPRVCPRCEGARLRKEALAVTIGGTSVGDLTSKPVADALKTIESWNLDDRRRKLASVALKQVKTRLEYLNKVGLGYLTLDRPIRTLSSGEQRRVGLTNALGSDLVDMLYVLDEPTTGLHPQDSERLRDTILELRDRGNTVVVVDHDGTILEASDKVVELGPNAGQDGGQIVFEGTVDEMKACEKSLTGSYLSGKRLGGGVPKRRGDVKKFVELVDASGHNLNNVNAIFPLGTLCVVTGVSGAGKSSLVQETLYPALCAKLDGDPVAVANGLPYKDLIGYEQIDDVVLLDQTPIGRSPRSNPVTYLKIFDDIRTLFAETPDAKAHNYAAGYFSFNVDGGRCDACKGEGYVQTNMGFMSDVYTRCPWCDGKRYQRSVLDVMYRGRNIADTLNMTAREAFGFFRGQPKIQQKLQRLLDVGLDYIQLGQPANTLSGGEAQRLKLASYLSTTRKGSCLYIMDEPTAGLHFADVVQLLDQLNALVELGNTVVVVEHNLLVMKAADYIIDLGPGAAEQGGSIVAEGSPEEVAANPASKTGAYLARILAQR